MESIEYQSPTPTNARKDAIERYAEAVAEALAYKPGASLVDLVNKLGGDIRLTGFSAADLDHDEAIVIDDYRKFKIFLPPDTSPTRDRFTIAHELGHYFLHFPNAGRPMKATRLGSDRVEWEANWFAASLLMPAKQFRSGFKQHNGDIVKLARHFGVSEKAAQIRAKALGLIQC